LYEPQYGGDYDVFRIRPLNQTILIYSAHDARYMLELYRYYCEQMQALGAPYTKEWMKRIVVGSELRCEV